MDYFSSIDISEKDIKQILTDYEDNGTNFHRRGDLGATIIPSRNITLSSYRKSIYSDGHISANT